MKNQLRSVVFMFAISVVFASLVSTVMHLSEQTIAANQALKLKRIILRVLDIVTDKNTSRENISRLFVERVRDIYIGDRIIYVGYGADGYTVQGYAFPVGGAGFWGPIQGMVGVDPAATKVLGLAFYKHMETPGLGGRITENWFVNQFEGLRLFPIKGDQKIFYLKPAGTTSAPNELDAITGATNTSSAVENFLNKDLDYFLKEVWKAVEEKE